MKARIYKLFHPNNKIIIMGVLFIIISMTYLICLDKFNTPISYLLYLLMSYSLAIFVVKVYDVIKNMLNKVITNNRYLSKYKEDYILRHKISLYFSLGFNILYALFKLVLGILYKSVWFISFAIYYLLLIIIRTNLANIELRHNGSLKSEYLKYRKGAILLMFLNIILTVIVLVTLNYNITITYHMYIVISMAVYTFVILIESIRGFVKYKKYKRPVISLAKTVNVIVSLMSMLSLEIVMLSTYGDISSTSSKYIIILTGLGISLIIFSICIYMIVNSTKWLNNNK